MLCGCHPLTSMLLLAHVHFVTIFRSMPIGKERKGGHQGHCYRVKTLYLLVFLRNEFWGSKRGARTESKQGSRSLCTGATLPPPRPHNNLHSCRLHTFPPGPCCACLHHADNVCDNAQHDADQNNINAEVAARAQLAGGTRVKGHGGAKRACVAHNVRRSVCGCCMNLAWLDGGARTCSTSPLSLALLLLSLLVTRFSWRSMSSTTGLCRSSSSCKAM
jgi:hypothetical protein